MQTTEKHITFGYWWAFLPDLKNDKCDIGGLALLITLESNSSGRSAAFTVLLSLLTSSKLYLLQADTRLKIFIQIKYEYEIVQYYKHYLFQQTHDNVFYTIFCSTWN